MISLGCAIALALLGPAAGDDVADEVARLSGHTVQIADDGKSYTIEDIAGEGKPVVGTVQRRDADLWLVAAEGEWKLKGPLAVPRIAGPGYKVWVLGDTDDVAGSLTAKRIGILRAPSARHTGRLADCPATFGTILR